MATNIQGSVKMMLFCSCAIYDPAQLIRELPTEAANRLRYFSTDDNDKET